MKHGTTSAYTRHGCRCDLCRAAQRDFMRAYRARRPDYVEQNRETSRRYRVAQRETLALLGGHRWRENATSDGAVCADCGLSLPDRCVR